MGEGSRAGGIANRESGLLVDWSEGMDGALIVSRECIMYRIREVCMFLLILLSQPVLPRSPS